MRQAMWLRDSANQMQSYRSLLHANSSYDSIASLYRGVINLQARYINQAPYCNSFQPPLESGLAPTQNQPKSDTFTPAESNQTVFECKYELDSLAAFLEISTDYYEATRDIQFFRDFQWLSAVNTIIATTEANLVGTYAANGSVNRIPYTWERDGTGLIRSAFRPSDDA
jgi:meiotically up-regulated gene 157 (Mug157) protein